MSLNARFIADFTSFYDAAQKADVELRGMETGAAKVQLALNRMGDSFSGRKIVQDAVLATEAIDRIGGASQLTEAEQAKVNRTVTEAIEKYQALGLAAPKAMQDLAAATTQASSVTKNWEGLLTSAAGAIGVGFSVGAIVNFGKSVVDAGADLYNTAQRVGVSTDAIQGFKFAADQTGTTLDSMTRALNKLQVSLATNNDKSVTGALDALHLKLADLRAMRPEDAFLAITDAIKDMANPMDQAKTGAVLMGRGFNEILPAVRRGMEDLASSAPKMSDATVRALHDSEEAWKRLKDTVVTYSGGVIAAGDNMVDTFKRRIHNIETYGLEGARILKTFETQFGNFGAGFGKDVNLPAPFTGAAGVGADKVDRFADAVKRLADELSGRALALQVRELETAFLQISKAGPLSADALQRTADAAGKLAGEGGHLSPQLFALVVAFGELDPKVKDGITGMGELGEKWHIAIPDLRTLADMLPTVGSGIDNLMSHIPKLDLAFQFSLAKEKAVDFEKELAHMGQVAEALGRQIGGGFGEAVGHIGEAVRAASGAEKAFDAAGKAFGPGGAGILSGLTSAASGVMGIASAAIAAGQALKAMWDHFFGTAGRQSVEQFAATMGGFDALHAQLLALDKAGGHAGEDLWKALTQGVGRNNPAQAAAEIQKIQDALAHSPSANASAAGYQTIAELQTIAAAAEKTAEYMRDSGLYAASAVADAFKKAGDAAAAAMDTAASAAVMATTTARDQAQKTLDDLTGQIKSLQQSINQEAPEAVMGSIEAAQRAQLASLQQQQQAAQKTVDELNAQISDASTAAIAAATDAAGQSAQLTVERIRQELGDAAFNVRVHVDLDGMPSGLSLPGLPGFAAGTQGKYVNFGAGTLAMLHGRERVSTEQEGQNGGSSQPIIVQVQIDGRVAAEAVVPHIPIVVQRYGLA